MLLWLSRLEQLIRNQQVAGSNPASSSKKTEYKAEIVFLKNERERPVDRMGTLHMGDMCGEREHSFAR